MSKRFTVKVRREWAERACEEAGGVTAWAEALGIDKGTASRQRSGIANASPEFIGAVLNRYPIKFEVAFEPVDNQLSA
ncbi:hypothetical protein [Schaalia cardiffensis]|uniref:hypothetical protein n=1 Tax=Schaalia cardiffensis TaxID=181487 RepID=UPI0023F2FE11|nr:hypothetical protein [Schaalia cardiffensis]